jgi:CheY-like chemotaxis protein
MARSIRPDLIIGEVIMPDMDGIEAAIIIRRFLPHCKILLFSGHSAAADLLESARARGHEFEILAKPVHPSDLLAKLREDFAPINLESRPVAVPYVAPSPTPGPVRTKTPAKAVRLAPKERFTPFFAVKLIGLYAIFLAKLIVVLVVVFGILAVIGYGIDQVIVSARPHLQRQHYEPEPHDDVRFRLLKT